MSKKQVTSVSDLVDDHLGGPAKAAELFGCTAQRVWNWKNSNKIPSSLYLEHKHKLEQQGIDASISLWFGEKAGADA